MGRRRRKWLERARLYYWLYTVFSGWKTVIAASLSLVTAFLAWYENHTPLVIWLLTVCTFCLIVAVTRIIAQAVVTLKAWRELDIRVQLDLLTIGGAGEEYYRFGLDKVWIINNTNRRINPIIKLIVPLEHPYDGWDNLTLHPIDRDGYSLAPIQIKPYSVYPHGAEAVFFAFMYRLREAQWVGGRDNINFSGAYLEVEDGFTGKRVSLPTLFRLI